MSELLTAFVVGAGYEAYARMVGEWSMLCYQGRQCTSAQVVRRLELEGLMREFERALDKLTHWH